MNMVNSRPYYVRLTIDFAMAFIRVTVLFENKKLVFLGTPRGKGYDSRPFATGTCDFQLEHEICYGIQMAVKNKKGEKAQDQTEKIQ